MIFNVWLVRPTHLTIIDCFLQNSGAPEIEQENIRNTLHEIISEIEEAVTTEVAAEANSITEVR